MDILKEILEIAENNKEGFTIYLPSLEFVQMGWVIANKYTQNQYGIEGLNFVYNFAINHNRIIGGYKNQNGIFQWDASIVEPNKEIAIKLMILHKQDSIFNLETHTLIWNK